MVTSKLRVIRKRGKKPAAKQANKDNTANQKAQLPINQKGQLTAAFRKQVERRLKAHTHWLNTFDVRERRRCSETDDGKGRRFKLHNLEADTVAHCILPFPGLISSRIDGSARVLPFEAMEGLLVGADLRNADFEGVHLWKPSDAAGTPVPAISLARARLQSADLCKVNFSNVDMERCNLSHAFLEQGSFSRVSFRSAKMESCSLTRAEFFRCDFTNANVSMTLADKARFCECDFEGVSLMGTNLDQSAFQRCMGIFQFGPIGAERRMGILVRHGTVVKAKLGCFWGTVDEAIEAVLIKYGRVKPRGKSNTPSAYSYQQGQQYIAMLETGASILLAEWARQGSKEGTCQEARPRA